MRDRLIELHKQAFEHLLETGQEFSHENYADYLLANGVVVIDMSVVSPQNRPLITQCLGRPLDEIIEIVSEKLKGGEE